MRFLLWMTLLMVLVGAIVAPISYLYTASQLPQLENEFDLERHLREFVEGERMSMKMGQAVREKGGVAYIRPDFAKLPKDLVALYIDSWDCPTFFQTPRETGFAWSWRVFDAWAFNRQPPGDGSCEWQIANHLAWAIHLRGGMKQAIAASKIHAFLTKDQLVAYDLSSRSFERAVVGIDDAARTLFRRPADQLTLSELTELELALPPNNYYDELKHCRGSTLLRQARDILLTRPSRHGLVPEDKAKGAQAAPLSCTR